MVSESQEEACSALLALSPFENLQLHPQTASLLVLRIPLR